MWPARSYGDPHPPVLLLSSRGLTTGSIGSQMLLLRVLIVIPRSSRGITISTVLLKIIPLLINLLEPNCNYREDEGSLRVGDR